MPYDSSDCNDEAPAAATADHEQQLQYHPLDEVLEMCGGEIIPMVPNLQLFHFMLAYGHCGGGEGVCVDTIPRVMFVQSRIYERYISSISHTFSGAIANNSQSKFVPNDWIDTFCKLTLDADAGIPRIKKLGASFKAALLLSADGDARKKDMLLLQMGRDMDSCTGLFRRACIQCYERRLVDMPSLQHPDVQVSTRFPAQTIRSIASAGEAGSQGRKDMIQECR